MTTVGFDIAALGALPAAALRGAAVVIAARETVQDRRSAGADDRRRPAPPSCRRRRRLWQTLLADGGAHCRISTALRMLTGGEALPGELAPQSAQRMAAALANLYGPTETTIWSAVMAVAAR